MNKKIMLMGILLVFSLGLSACGEPGLSIDSKQQDDVNIIVNGTTDSEAKVSFEDKSGEKENEDVDKDGKFSIHFPRLTSTVNYKVTSKKGDKITTKSVSVPKQKPLTDYETLKDHFNTFSERADDLSVTIPEELDKDSHVNNGFRINTDGSNVMSVLLIYAPENSLLGMESYADFYYSIGALSSSLDISSDVEKLLKTLTNSQENEKDTEVNISGVTYKFSSTGGITSASIFPAN
ncbi:hypothetical protein HB816_13875 [Listeria booriae]|uniref:hypothetical protein n=1 Tax=Listeria booriae TaxID=1552123 RepID=UPI00162A2FF5|nr:hypothetical protein [Listeria booriae]MBC1231539.1 hypothetical protein [Listeria booriae]